MGVLWVVTMEAFALNVYSLRRVAAGRRSEMSLLMRSKVNKNKAKEAHAKPKILRVHLFL